MLRERYPLRFAGAVDWLTVFRKIYGRGSPFQTVPLQEKADQAGLKFRVDPLGSGILQQEMKDMDW